MQDVPVPIVAKAEMECSLPGMGSLIKALAPRVKLARTSGAQGHVDAWAVAHALYEYSERPDVQAALKNENHLPDGRVRPGRPKVAHRLVMDELVKRGLVSERTIQRWVYEWHSEGSGEATPHGVALKLGLKPGCPESEFNVIVAQNSSRLADWVDGLLGVDEDKPKQVADITEVIDKTAAHVGRILGTRILSKKELELLAERLNSAFQITVNSALPLYVDYGPQAKAKHKIGTKSPFQKE